MGGQSPLPPATFIPGPVQVPPAAEAACLIVIAVVTLLLLGPGRRVRGRFPPAFGPVLGVGGALLVLLSGEVTLRLHERYAAWPFVAHPVTIWSCGANLQGKILTGVPFFTNSLGLREVDVDFPKEPGEFRILCLGDSWTWGHGVRQDRTFPRRLQAILRETCPQDGITVVNAGQPGFSYCQGYHLLKDLLPRYRPDLVLSCGFNHVSNEEIPAQERDLPDGALAREAALLLRNLRMYILLRQEAGRGGLIRPAPATPAGDPDSLAGDFEGEMARLCREQGVPVAFFRHAYFPWEAGPDDKPRDLSEAEITVLLDDRARGRLDFRVTFAHTAYPEGGWILPGDPARHPNETGHEALARGLARVLTERGFVPCAAGGPR